MHYEFGLKRDFTLVEEMPVGETLTLGLDWNVNFGDGKYLDYLYGVGRGYGAEEDDFARGNKDGIGGTTLKAVLTWQICECFSIGGVLAYTSLLNETIRDGYRDSGWYGNYKDDCVWGGVQAKLEF
jgi:outer membrane scaffolding protein for murein synthesis (MipA/OmpV family)